MTAYYNEIDPYAAQWLRNLIEAGHIAPGEVDTRSIVDVRAADLAGFDQCHFFAGLGGWSGALRLAGVPDAQPLWTGSCPCQPFSRAGKQKGFADDRHLWPVWRELIREQRPAKVFGEQVASAAEWLGLVRGDLEALGYAVGTLPIKAASAGADHLRDRFWFVASDDVGLTERPGWNAGQQATTVSRYGDSVVAAGSGLMAHADPARPQGRQLLPECAGERVAGPDGVDVAYARSDGAGRGSVDSAGAQGTAERIHWRSSRAGFAPRIDGEILEWVIGADGKARRVKPGVRLLAHGIPARVAKLRALGNAIDLRPAAAFIRAAID